MYKIFDGRAWAEFDTYEKLINWLSQFNFDFPREYNSFLMHTGTNPGDTYLAGGMTPSGEYIGYVTRDKRVLNEDNVSIYSKKLIDDVLNYKLNPDLMNQWYKENYINRKHKYYSGRFVDLPSGAFPKFRNGPWPGIHSRWKYRVCRRIKTTNEKRQTTSAEMQGFNRGSRGKNLVSSWDDIYRDFRDSGWKSQSKSKHQWENKVKVQTKRKYGKGVYVHKEEPMEPYEKGYWWI